MVAIALLGSGEFLPWSRPVDEWCIAQATSGSDRALVVPTASAPEGDDVFARWARMGIDHYTALGMRPEVLELRTQEDAHDPTIVDAVAGARIIFFSGGNPGYLAETVAASPFWEAVVAGVTSGATALGGCSAGAVAIGAMAPFVADDALERWVSGLELLPRAFVLPHFDMLDSYAPGLRGMFLGARPEGTIAVGIDENTALYGDGEHWRVAGEGAAWLSAHGAEEDLRGYREGEEVSVSLGPSLP